MWEGAFFISGAGEQKNLKGDGSNTYLGRRDVGKVSFYFIFGGVCCISSVPDFFFISGEVRKENEATDRDR